MIILAIETSCDETSIALLEGNEQTREVKLLSNIVSSQVKIHAKWGGVVPDLAAREHLKNIIPVLEKSLLESKKTLLDVNLFTVTKGPGLIPALLIGTNFAKTLSYLYKKPLLGIHHIEGHIFANFIGESSKFKVQSSKYFPMIALVVSGGHTQLIYMERPLSYKIIGETQDDAAGEAFDKVAKLLKLGYPGGPVVSTRADNYLKNIKSVNDKKLREKLENILFPRPMLTSNNFDFSFSGLKTAVLYFYQDLIKLKDPSISQNRELFKDAICYQFQRAATEVLITKTLKAAKKYQPKTIALAGGVAANKKLRDDLGEMIKNNLRNTQFLIPHLQYCGDNAAMIGAAAFYRYLTHGKAHHAIELDNTWETLEADANFKLASI